MGLLLEDEADCLNHQHKRRRHWPPIRRQRRAAAPYRASGLVHVGLSRHSSIGAGQAGMGRFPVIHRSVVANDSSHGKRTSTCDPLQPFGPA
ncbi:hypothetical protein OKW30_006018 [Paraburkholderia sp. Clong3]